MKPSKARILLVEDDASLGFVTKDNLSKRGYEVVHARDGKEALRYIASDQFDLFLLDVMLPYVDGIEIAERIRKMNQRVPIMFISAKSMPEDKLAGLKTGADDYVTKPFNLDELDLKIQVFLRRSNMVRQPEAENETYTFGEFFFDFSNLTLRFRGKDENLTLREAEVLRLLCRKLGQVVPRQDLLNEIWGKDDYFLGRSLDVFICRLRKFLKADPNVHIVNIHGVGFKLQVSR